MTFLGGICQDGSSRAICMDDEFTLCKRRDMTQRDPFLPNIHKCKRGGLCKTNQHPTHVPIMTLRRGEFGWTGLRQHLNLSNMFFLEFYTTLMTTFMTISISNLLAVLGFSYVTERLHERIKAIFVLNHYRNNTSFVSKSSFSCDNCVPPHSKSD